MKSLKDVTIGNIEQMVSEIVGDEKMTKKQRSKVLSYMSAIGTCAFRLGYQVGKEEMTEEQFNDILFGKNRIPEVLDMLSEVTFRVGPAAIAMKTADKIN